MLLSLQVARALLQPHSFYGGQLPTLNPDVLNDTEVGTEAEAIDAELEGGAAAVEESVEEGFELEGAGDVSIGFGGRAGGEFFPAGGYRSVIAETPEEEVDFAEGETHVSGE